MGNTHDIVGQLKRLLRRRPMQPRIDELHPSRDWHRVVAVGIILSLSLIAVDVFYMLDVTASVNGSRDAVRRGESELTQFEQTVSLYRQREEEFQRLHQIAPAAPSTSKIPRVSIEPVVVGTSTGTSTTRVVQ